MKKECFLKTMTKGPYFYARGVARNRKETSVGTQSDSLPQLVFSFASRYISKGFIMMIPFFKHAKVILSIYDNEFPKSLNKSLRKKLYTG